MDNSQFLPTNSNAIFNAFAWIRSKHHILSNQTAADEFEAEFNCKIIYDPEYNIMITGIEFRSAEELLMFVMRWGD